MARDILLLPHQRHRLFLATTLVLLGFLCSLSAAQNGTTPAATCPPCPCFSCLGNNDLCKYSGACNGNGTCICPAGSKGEQCSEWQCLNSGVQNSDGTCTCGNKGWEGIHCEVCQEDAVCKGLPGQGDKSTCNKTWVPTVAKQLSCASNDTTLVSLLGVSSLVTANLYVDPKMGRWWNFQVIRHAEAGATPVPQTNLFSCRLINCADASTPDSFTWDCANVSCILNCVQDVDAKCTAILKSVVGIVTGPGKVVCANNGTTCFVQEPRLNTFFRNGLRIDCTAGECVNPDALQGDTPPPSPTPTPMPDTEGSTKAVVPGALISVIMLGGIVGALGFTAFVMLVWKKGNKNTSEFVQVNHQDVNSYLRGLHNHGQGPMPLSFDKIGYTIKKKGSDVQLLKNVTGVAYPGELMAIMGPSGAGKSTLLDILSKRSKRGKVSGEVLVGGRPRTKKFKRYIGFVDQEDCLIGTLTVRESLTYSALLRLPDSVPNDMKRKRVADVMEDLKIANVKDSRIGTTFSRGISGGEKRRVSIAMELVTCPSILFLDEPTSGLDSHNAYVVVDCLSRLAKHDMTTVIMTIHQPRSNIYRLFDKLLLLAGGEMAYFGLASQASNYFAGIGYRCPSDYNPADFFIDTLVAAEIHSDDKTGNGAEPEDAMLLDPASSEVEVEGEGDATLPMDSILQTNRIHDLVDKYGHSDLAQRTQAQIQTITEGEAEHPSDHSQPKKSSVSASLSTQVLVLSHRTALNLLRNPFLFVGHMIASAFIGLVVGAIYFGMGESVGEATTSQSLVAQFEQRLGVLLILCAFLAFGSLSSLELFHSERALYMHERANRFYYPSSYFISKVLFDLVPLRILPPILMGTIAYLMIGLRGGFIHYLYFIIALVLVNVVATSICMIIGVLSKRLSTGNLIASMIMLFSLMLTDIFNNRNTMPPALRWLHYVSFFNYGYEALVINELDGTYLGGSILGVATQVSGTEILMELGFEPEMFFVDLYVLLGLLLFNLSLAYLCLKYLVRQKR
eukprot:comp19566_c0_seq1/m.22975 comp19566_c0_seq1/g.22975  ORF comp19566_c0_seq1/g.22975 comp19566_c0_seq1/m.22975 type:complete len:1015 (-) comp19566_c0_seq1:143-3187(-)